MYWDNARDQVLFKKQKRMKYELVLYNFSVFTRCDFGTAKESCLKAELSRAIYDMLPVILHGRTLIRSANNASLGTEC